MDRSPTHTAVLPSTPSALSLHPALPSDNPQRRGYTLDHLLFLFTVLVIPLFLSLGDLKPQHPMLNESKYIGISILQSTSYFRSHLTSILFISVGNVLTRNRAASEGFPGGSNGKESACNAGDPGSIPGLGRSPGEGNGNPPQYSCLENPMDKEGWKATAHGVRESQTELSD